MSTPHMLKAVDDGKSEGTGLSRIVTRVRRSFSHSHKRRRTEDSDEEWGASMHTTPAERVSRAPLPSTSTAALALRSPPSASRPTIEQIAMGLHVSRTPHLRGGTPHGPPTAATPSPQRRAALPPPTRSALKQPIPKPPSSAGTTITPGMSASGSTADTSTLETPTSVAQLSGKPAKSRRPSVAGGLSFRRMSDFLTHTRGTSTTVSTHKYTPRASSESPRRRVVRFEGADDA